MSPSTPADPSHTAPGIAASTMPTVATSNGTHPSLSRVDDVFVIDLGAGHNRLDVHVLNELLAFLDTVETAPSPKALLTTAHGTTFSIGLDLDWIAGERERGEALVRLFHRVLAKMLRLNAYTVAAIQGHAYGGGLMLALAHDHVLMNSQKGYVSLPEIDLPVALTEGMMALLCAKASTPSVAEALLTGRRYSADQAVRAGFVHAALPSERLSPSGSDIARRHAAKDPVTLQTFKARIYAQALLSLDALGPDMPNHFPGYSWPQD